MPRSSEFDRTALNAILAQQYQVISRSQAMASGITKDALAHRLRAAGPWQRLLPGVYLAVTGVPTSDQRDVAALLVRRTREPAQRNRRAASMGRAGTVFQREEFIGSPDAWWQYAGVAAEVDSNEYHLSPEDHERTLARDRRMRKYSINVLHFTPRQIRTQPTEVISTIKSALAAANFHPPRPVRAVSVTAVPSPDKRRASPGTR